MPGRRMTRRVDTLEVHSTRWGMKRMELDVSFPPSCLIGESHSDGPSQRCLIPAAFIPKEPVAVDLEVRDAQGDWVSVPTRRECKLLTEQAIALIGDHGADLTKQPASVFTLHPDLRHRIGDVITKAPLEARVSRLYVEQRMGLATEVLRWLLPLLRRLEDNYLLWAPIEGSPLGDHHLSIQRSDRRRGEQFFWPARRSTDTVVVESKAGPILGRWRPPSKWLFVPSPSAIFGRLLLTFGLMPVKFDEESLEAHRFASYHLAMVPPAGVVVREAKAGRIPESEWGKEDPRIDEIETGVDRTVHGEDTRTGHVHLEMNRNPKWLNSRFTFGLRPGTTTLWAMVVVLTCGLLWALAHELDRVLRVASGPSEIEIQIVAAVLLVGPTFAASWTLRNNPTLIRSMVVGAQGLLLSSAIVSVAAALALAGFRPFDWSPAKTIDWYATLSYAIAVMIMTGWLQARSWVWWIYRHILSSTTMNLLATSLFVGAAYAGLHYLDGVPVAAASAPLLAGFGLTAVAGNRTSVGLGQNSRFAAFLAGLGALVCLTLAARRSEFLEQVPPDADAFSVAEAVLVGGGAMALGLFVLSATREFVQKRRNNQSSGFSETLELAGVSPRSEAPTT